ncbi:unnamed protein product [Mytilus coruscus]|uniref:Uncharacterized protein n=1 Tax=Mytilus coruscus TaxID=42192 RepID=A0A6J8ARY5_MYTCO|nr:unnamed protein product [Mytilus coruscus]
MTDYENDYNEECEDTQYQDNDYDDTYEDHDQVDVPPSKRQADDNSLSKFASMSKRIKARETLGAKIDETLADNVTELFRYDMNEDQFVQLTKDENTPRHETVKGLATGKNKPAYMGYNITTSTICRDKSANIIIGVAVSMASFLLLFVAFIYIKTRKKKTKTMEPSDNAAINVYFTNTKEDSGDIYYTSVQYNRFSGSSEINPFKARNQMYDEEYLVFNQPAMND